MDPLVGKPTQTESEDTVRVVTNQRKPWVAFLLSWPCPGLGHLYVGDLWGVLLSLLAVYVSMTGFLPFALSASIPLTIWLIWLAPIIAFLLVPLYAAIAAKRAPVPYALQPYNRWYVYVGAWLGWSLLSSFAFESIRDKVIEGFRIPSGSMEPSVLVGDFIYVDKRENQRSSITRRAIITFQSVEEEGMTVIKRVVALPGDTIAMVEGRFLINYLPVEEPYIQAPQGRSEEPMQRAKMRQWQMNFLVGGPNPDYQPDLSDWGPLIVPPASYFVMGDNRDAAYDSRYWGFVPSELVNGIPSVVYWSYDKTSFRPLPFLTAIRWNRIGRDISH
jgi:signal peptidase I